MLANSLGENIILTVTLFLQFFWMVTDTYREGTIKEMRKWSYEIYSTFLAERAVSISFSFPKLLEWADVMVSLTIHYPKFPPKKHYSTFT